MIVFTFSRPTGAFGSYFSQYFTMSSFGKSQPVFSEVQRTPANDRRHQEWYTCDRCGWWYPREKMMNQNGYNLCTGPDTRNCWDLPGHAANALYLDIPYEQRPEPLPYEDVDL